MVRLDALATGVEQGDGREDAQGAQGDDEGRQVDPGDQEPVERTGPRGEQYPLKMATMGMEAIAKVARGGEKPKTSEGLDFFNTGVALVTDKPAEGVESITSAEGAKLCWGN